MQDVCIYDPVPVKEIDATELSIETIALRLLPAIMLRRLDVHPLITGREACHQAFALAEAFLAVAQERKEP
jgi:hypothetical protein